MITLTSEFVQQKRIIKSHYVPGGGGQAKGFVILRQWGERWVTHFYNCQDGGFYCGHYWNTLNDAESSFKNRVEEYKQRLATFAHD